MGLDPPTLRTLSPLLHSLAKNNAPRLLLTLRAQDPIPDWITHLIYLDPSLQVANQGRKDNVLKRVRGKTEDSRSRQATQISPELGRKLTARGIEVRSANSTKTSKQEIQTHGGPTADDQGSSNAGEPLVEMENVQVRYGDKQVLGGWVQDVDGQPRQGLWWTVRRGQRWGVFGPNGE